MGESSSGASQEQRPVLLAVDSDVEALRRISKQLHQRYGADYNVLCERSPAHAREQLEEMRKTGGQVAVVRQILEFLEGEAIGPVRRQAVAPVPGFGFQAQA